MTILEPAICSRTARIVLSHRPKPAVGESWPSIGAFLVISADPARTVAVITAVRAGLQGRAARG